jgi:hypothetical protein
MNRRSVAWTLSALPVVIALGVAAESCSSNPPPAGLAEGCSINSDCQSPLICAFGLCHDACTESRDCPDQELCVASGSDHVCELPKESACGTGSEMCASPLVCGSDDTCRNACSATSPCAVANQACTNGACFDVPSTDGGADATSDTSTTPDASTGDSSSPDTSSVDAPAEAMVEPDAGPLGFLPSNVNLGSLAIADGGLPDSGVVGMNGGIDWTNAPDVVISANCDNSCLGVAPIVVTQSDGSTANLYVLMSLKIDASTVLRPSSSDTVPVIYAVQTTVEITGALDVSSNYTTPGPGATSGDGQFSQGPGAGGNAQSVNYPNSGAGGGAYCGAGGAGAATSGANAPGGLAASYGTPTLSPLVAGSGGGFETYAGAGGGAVQISAGVSILVRNVGWINAGGGGGNNGGGGSGGGILLEAPTITIQGNLAANGGGGGVSGVAGLNTTPNAIPAPGGDSPLGGSGSAGTTINGADATSADGGATLGSGGGGAGYIRLNTLSGSANVTGATISPALGTACATQGTITY